MPEMSLGNGYTIDLADGWTFVHALQDAQKQISDGYQANILGMLLQPPGNDGHSGTFISGMTTKAVEQHRTWYLAKMQQLGTMIDSATGILHQYGIAETENTIQWQAAVKYDPNDDSDTPRGRHGAV
jgi:hypothetical protein